MLHRMTAAGIALLGACCLAAPLAISAGMNAGMNAGMSGRPAAPSLPLVDPGKPIPNPPPQSGGNHQHFAFRSFRHHEGAEPGTPLWWGAAGYYPQVESEPSEAPGYVYLPRDFTDRPRPQVLYQPGCRTDTVTVPSESGGQRAINITRCY
jgi:hypothetical protein